MEASHAYRAGRPPRAWEELRASAVHLNNRLTAILHLGGALSARAVDLALDEGALRFVATRAEEARGALLAAATLPSEGSAAGALAAIRWTLDDPALRQDAAALARVGDHVAKAAAAVQALEGTFQGFFGTLRDDADALREELAGIVATLALPREPLFLARERERLETAPASAGDDIVAATRALARTLLDARAARDSAHRILDARAAAERAVDLLWEELAHAPLVARLRAIQTPFLRARLSAALDHDDASSALEALAAFRARIDALRERAPHLGESLGRVAAAGERPLLQPAIDETLARLLLDAEVERPLPSALVEPALVAAIERLAGTRVGDAVTAWPACDAWIVLSSEKSPSRRVTSDLATLVQARASLTHARELTPLLQQWAALAAQGLPVASGRELQERLTWLARHEARLVSLEIPRALGVVRAAEAALDSDRVRERVVALTRGQRDPHRALLQNLLAKLPPELAAQGVPREAVAAIVETLLGPPTVVRVEVKDAALAPLVLREVARRWVATTAELAAVFSTDEPTITDALESLRASPQFLYDAQARVAIVTPREARDLDGAWKLRGRIEAAVKDRARAAALFDAARAAAVEGRA